MNEMEILQGTIAAVVFQNYDNGYSVLRLQCQDGQTITVVGTIPLPVVGEQLMVTGRWSNHSNYGKQFEAEFLERLMPQTSPQILKYLSGRVIKGIGPKIAARIVDKFGDNTLLIMEREPHRLSEVAGITEARALAIGEEFRLQIGIRHLMEFFGLHNLSAELAVKTYKRYGEAAMDMLYENPYLLTEEQLDAPFGAVDQFAIELGVEADDPRRVDAAVIFELQYNLNAGHSFLPESKLLTATGTLLSLEAEVIAQSIHRLVESGQLAKDFLAGTSIVYLPKAYVAELYTTERLLALAQTEYPAPARGEAMLKKAAKDSHILYSAQQEDAIRAAMTNALLLITGGPGTGKTTILNGILSLYEQMGLKCLLAAPTGRAAKRLTEVTGRDASTIHRLLEATLDPKTDLLYFAKNESDPLKADAIIVDEMSMVDILLLHSLLQAVPGNCRLILVGDPDQLPPVGPGFPFNDMLRSNVLPSVRLTDIFRQAQESLIVMNAHRVNHGEMPCLTDVKNDFFFLKARSDEEVADLIVNLCRNRLPKNMGILPEQIQVLSPTKKGPAGTILLNKYLQNALNPAAPNKREKQYGEVSFREGDRVMQIRNNYDLLWKKTDGSQIGTGIFNGDVGVISEIDPAMEQLTIVFDDRIAVYDFTQLNELELAYAMTVHKSQGSEYRAVILAAWNGSQYLLNRSVLYTAITRARELLIIVGRTEVITHMTENGKTGRRYTGLKLRLQGQGGN